MLFSDLGTLWLRCTDDFLGRAIIWWTLWKSGRQRKLSIAMAPLKLKVWLAGEVENLCVAQSDVDSLRDEMSSLNRALEGSKAAEQLALD